VGPSPQIRVAANEEWLWLAVVTGSQSSLFFREASGGFDLGRSANHRIAAMAALDRDLLVFFDDAAVYRYRPDTTARPTAEAVLPQSHVPLDMAGEDGVLYAIISSAAASELPPVPVEDATPASQPFDAGDAPLSLAKYDGRAWYAVAPLPPLVQPGTNARLQPRLCVLRGRLLLLTPAEQPNHIFHFYHDGEKNQWVPRGTVGVPQLSGFWAVNFSNTPTLVTVSPSPAGGETIKVLRLLGEVAQAEATAWQPAPLKLSELPEGVTAARYAGAFGFNQHLGLLAIDTNGTGHLRFALISQPPAEPTQPIPDVLAEPGLLRRSHRLVQMFTFALLLAVLIGLFVFRRGSMINLIELPPGCALSFNVQRMLGWLIDFAPFTLVGAMLLDVPWGQGLRSLARWGISPDPQGSVPEQKVVLWWAFSVLCYTTYMLVMELITLRSPGKYFARIYLLSESGTRPAARQILTRNLTRLIEFMPQFWIFIVLVLLSRNRQRMGDIFARTVAVRLTPARPAVPDRKAPGPPDKQPAEPSRDEAAAAPDSDEPDSARAGTPDAENESSPGPGSEEPRSPESRDG